MVVSPLPCDEDYAPVFWLGKPCAMTAIKMPDANYSRPGDDHYTTHDLLDGYAASRMMRYRRVWSLSYSWLFRDAASVLMEYVTRQRGIGPFVFIDPHVRNFLTPNQASGTDSLVSTEGFTVTGTGEVLSSSSVQSVRGIRSLLWTFASPVTGSGGVLKLNAPTGHAGWVTPASQSWAFSGQVRSVNDSSVPMQPRMTWLDASGGIVSSVTGVALNGVTGSWTSFCVTGSAPVNACYLDPSIVVSGAGVINGTGVYVDELQLEMDDECNPWDYGQGQPIVSVKADGESVPRVGRTSLTYTLTEVTP